MQTHFATRVIPYNPQEFFINVLLTILGYIPGIIHAVYIIIRH